MALSSLVRQAAAGALRPLLSTVARAVIDDGLTYLSPTKLWVIERCLRTIERTGVAGDVIECGIAAGGSAILLASSLPPGRRFKGYDVFGMIPPPSERDESDAHRRYRV